MSESQGSSPGAPPPSGPDHTEGIAGEPRSGFTFDRSASDRCGVTMSAGIEGNAIAEIMSQKEGV